MGVGTQVVIVVVEGETKVAVVHVSVRTQAGALPHPPAEQAAASILREGVVSRVGANVGVCWDTYGSGRGEHR